jgi:hypothetical protein
VIGYELIAARDGVRINLPSLWMLANALRAIVAGWNFQLCADVPSNFCNRSADLLEFSVTSIPCQNNVLCVSIIRKATESEKVYKLTYDDLRTAVSHLCKDPILCKPHATGKSVACICIHCFFLIQCPTSIAASQYSHVKYFPNQDAYGEYYDFVVDICDIGVESFATRAQTSIWLTTCASTMEMGCANWCETF